MTVLHEKVLEKPPIKLTLHEAPYHNSTAGERSNWIHSEIPFFSKQIEDLWKIYSTPFSAIEKPYLDPWQEITDRRGFIRYPLVTASYLGGIEEHTVGGAWIGDVRCNQGSQRTQGVFHIKVIREARSTAYPLLEYFICNIGSKFDGIKVYWDPRDPQDDPTMFFKRNGFLVESFRVGGGAAYLALKNKP